MIFLSVLNWLNAYADQIAAGIHPMSVICRNRQNRPEKGRPIVKKFNQGRKMARIRRMWVSKRRVRNIANVFDVCKDARIGSSILSI